MKNEIMKMGCYGHYSELQAAHFLGMPLGMLRALQLPSRRGMKPTPYVDESGQIRYKLLDLQEYLLWEKHIPRPRWHKRQPKPMKPSSRRERW